MLADWLRDMSKIGYGRSTDELKVAVKQILDKDGRPNPFRDNSPGYAWFKGFMRRHPEISVRQAESLPVNRAKGCSPKVLDRWFEEFTEFIKEHNLLNKGD